MLYEYKIKEIVKIYDGDTIRVIVDLGFHTTKQETFRLALINTPEVRGEERPEGLVSRDWLREKLNEAMEAGTEIIVKTEKDSKGKYGRYIAELFIEGVSINKQLVAEGLAEFKSY